MVRSYIQSDALTLKRERGRSKLWSMLSLYELNLTFQPSENGREKIAPFGLTTLERSNDFLEHLVVHTKMEEVIYFNHTFIINKVKIEHLNRSWLIDR